MTDSEFIELCESTLHLNDETERLCIEFDDIFQKLFQFINSELPRNQESLDRLSNLFNQVDVHKMGNLTIITLLRLTFMFRDQIKHWTTLRDRGYKSIKEESGEKETIAMFVGLL